MINVWIGDRLGGSWYRPRQVEFFRRSDKAISAAANSSHKARVAGCVAKSLAVFAFQDMEGERVNVSFSAANLRETINGYIFGNAPGFTMKQGEKIRWYTAAMGGLHTAHWHGSTVILDERMTDVVPLLPAEMHTVDMVPENPGMWMFHCHVEGLAIGMYTHYMVEPAVTLKPRSR